MTSTPAAPERVALDYAHDALEDEVRLFYNDCLDRGIKELPIREWLREFRSWLDEYEFERRYIDTQEWLNQRDARGE